MKLIVQIPCFNEADTLAATVADLPRTLPGVDQVEFLVVDDGSTDATVQVAREAGVDHIVRHRNNRGLAAAFQTGVEAALAQGADLIVNTDGDNQYFGGDVAALVGPLLDGRADIVIGDRQIATSGQFGPVKTWLQRIGSAAVSALSGLPVPDAVSGFRALSREAALRLVTLSRFSYTTEMIIQAGNKQMAIVSVPVRTNPQARASRLAKSTAHFLLLQGTTIVRAYAMYRPMRFFLTLAVLMLTLGSLPVLRFLFFYLQGSGAGHVQSLLLGTLLLGMGFLLIVTALLADVVSQNRKLLELTLEGLRRSQVPPPRPAEPAAPPEEPLAPPRTPRRVARRPRTGAWRGR